jgi:hypothetical protein
MDKNAKWARANIPEAAILSDSELGAVSNDAWRAYKKTYVAIFSVAIFAYLLFLKDPLARAIFGVPSFWQHLLIAMISGAILGGSLALIFQPLIRRRIRNTVVSK